jgi:SPP1 gp7 family putative phage head morphogenesis protein
VSDFPLLDRILKAWMSRGLISPEQAASIATALRGQVFSLADVWQEKVLEKVRDLLGKAMAEGWSVKEFKDAAASVVTRFTDGNYAEVVFRTNVANATAAGRYEEMFAPEYAGAAPYWEFRAVTDGRNDEPSECPDMRCRWLDGKTFRKDDESAKQFLPPLHFQCRCMSVERTEGSVRGAAISGADVPFGPVSGFGGHTLFGLFGGL